MSITRFAIVAGCWFVAAISSVGQAQVLYGTLTGNVTAPGDAAVPGVQIEATNQETNVKAEAKTDERGVYRLPNLQPGIYRVTATAASFRTYSQTNVPVQANEIR